MNSVSDGDKVEGDGTKGHAFATSAAHLFAFEDANVPMNGTKQMSNGPKGLPGNAPAEAPATRDVT